MTSTGIQNRYAALMACLGAGYGVLFTMLDDFRDEYGISESALGAVIGIGFFAGFLSQLVIAPRPPAICRSSRGPPCPPSASATTTPTPAPRAA